MKIGSRESDTKRNNSYQTFSSNLLNLNFQRFELGMVFTDSTQNGLHAHKIRTQKTGCVHTKTGYIQPVLISNQIIILDT